MLFRHRRVTLCVTFIRRVEIAAQSRIFFFLDDEMIAVDTAVLLVSTAKTEVLLRVKAMDSQILFDEKTAGFTAFLVGQSNVFGTPTGRPAHGEVNESVEKPHLPTAETFLIGPYLELGGALQFLK